MASLRPELSHQDSGSEQLDPGLTAGNDVPSTLNREGTMQQTHPRHKTLITVLLAGLLSAACSDSFGPSDKESGTQYGISTLPRNPVPPAPNPLYGISTVPGLPIPGTPPTPTR
jgi:hypothetical protein